MADGTDMSGVRVAYDRADRDFHVWEAGRRYSSTAIVLPPAGATRLALTQADPMDRGVPLPSLEFLGSTSCCTSVAHYRDMVE